MNEIPKLFIGVAISKLLTQISHVINIQFTFALNIHQSEGVPASIFTEWVSLSKNTGTILAVSSRRKDSKSRASPPDPQEMSSRARYTNSFFTSSPRVLAVMRISLMSALRCLGSAYRENMECSSAMCSGEKIGFLAPMSLAITAFRSFSCCSFFDKAMDISWLINIIQQNAIQIQLLPTPKSSPSSQQSAQQQDAGEEDKQFSSVAQKHIII